MWESDVSSYTARFNWARLASSIGYPAQFTRTLWGIDCSFSAIKTLNVKQAHVIVYTLKDLLKKYRINFQKSTFFCVNLKKSLKYLFSAY